MNAGRDAHLTVQAKTAEHEQSLADGVTGTLARLPEVGVIDRWFLSHEKVVWRWPYIEDAIVLEDPK